MSPLAYAQAFRPRFVRELAEFVRYASVSSQSQHVEDLRACAGWLAGHLASIGLDDARLVETAGHPIVTARWCHEKRAPTVLVYGHYDVQPAEPSDAWASPPFELQRRGQRLFGRGVVDDKGQMFALIKAIESFLGTTGRLPVNIVGVFEGEEEIGSPNLSPFLQSLARAVPLDVAIVSDTAMPGAERPALTESLRGALNTEIEVCGPREELHSGTFGGAIHNPLQVLCEIIARLHDSRGRIAIPGFYDQVVELSPAERAYMASVGPSDADILRSAKASLAWGEPGYSLYERVSVRPSLSINGITGGHHGPGTKAVIPAVARAQLDFRLTANQDPAEIERAFRRFVAVLAPLSVKVTVRTRFKAWPTNTDRNHPAMKVAARAYRLGFGRDPVLIRSGGTIPVVSLFQRVLRLPTVMMGFALPDSKRHAPNENLHLPTFFRGVRTVLYFFDALGTSG